MLHSATAEDTMKLRLLATGLLAAALTISACGTGGSLPSSTVTGTQDVPSPVPTIPIDTSSPAVSRASCANQMLTWSSLGGLSAIHKIGADSGVIHSAAQAGSLGAVQGAAATLLRDAQAALKIPPPACIPQERTDWTTAMHDFIASMTLLQVANIRGSNKWTAAANLALSRAIRDMNTWTAA